MSDLQWDLHLLQPIKTLHGRALRTLGDVDEFIRDRSAAPASPHVAGTLGALRAAAVSGSDEDCRLARERAQKLLRANRWG
ncbi:hypothetical protein [Ancylobacter mangrovi]|uniref:hypothetical protein n=1 Tax=Ancylobacter mangrovi TaxID=2972472 RepID=UPI0021613682|nr:hypothetical protein [Ancylobacter mangrovi]MCS0501422.1 hypothetical protein [Ancylobacter mangrovi]